LTTWPWSRCRFSTHRRPSPPLEPCRDVILVATDAINSRCVIVLGCTSRSNKHSLVSKILWPEPLSTRISPIGLRSATGKYVLYACPGPEFSVPRPPDCLRSGHVSAGLKGSRGGRIDPGCGRRLPKIDDARPDPGTIRPPPAPEPLFTRISAEIQMSYLCHICVIFGFVEFVLNLVLPCVLP
jgi:hypothetical protein